MTITEMHHVTAGMLSQKPPLGPKVGRPPKSAVARAASRWHVDEKSVLVVRCVSDKVFPGQYYDEESGLQYNWFRYYDPLLGRYITSDPIGLGSGTNTYSYAYQNVANYYDPDGNTPVQAAEGGWFLGEGLSAALNYVLVAATGSSIGVLIYEVTHHDATNSETATEKCKGDKCPPCEPYPVGTTGYQGPKTNVRGRDAGIEHYILFEVQQKAYPDCECIWKENTKGLIGHHHAYEPMGVNLTGLSRPPPYPGRLPGE